MSQNALRYLLVAMIAIELGLAGPASAAPNAPVREEFYQLEGGFYFREGDGTGCVERIASFVAYDYVVSSAAATLIARSKVFGGVSTYNWCTDTFTITAYDELTLDEFTLDRSSGFTSVKAHGNLVNTQTGGTVVAQLDLTFVSTTTPRVNILNPSRVDCLTASGVRIPCVRQHHARDGYMLGTFVVDSTDYVVPPGEPINGIVRSGAASSRLDTTCVMPTGTDPSECQLVQLP